MDDKYEQLLIFAIWQKKRLDQLEKTIEVLKLYKNGFDWFQKLFSQTKSTIA